MQLITQSTRTTPVAQSRLKDIDMNFLPFGRIFSDHMLIANYSDGKWQEPEILPYQKLEFAPSLCSIHYGQSIFEGLKAFRTQSGDINIFRPIDNFHRMNRSAYRMCMPEVSEDIFMGGMMELLRLDQNWIPSKEQGSLYIRPVYFATDEFVGIRPSDTYMFAIITCPVGGYYTKPVSLYVSRDFVRAAQGGTGSAKCAGNYAGALLPDKIAKSQGYDNILWLDAKEHTYVEECGTMNVFFVIDGTVITSPLSGTILPGINRDSVLQLLNDYDYKVEVRPISIYEIENAYDQGKLEEVFGAGTAASIASVNRVGWAGRDLMLPAMEDQRISSWLRNKLTQIKMGAEADPHGWIVKL